MGGRCYFVSPNFFGIPRFEFKIYHIIGDDDYSNVARLHYQTSGNSLCTAQ